MFFRYKLRRHIYNKMKNIKYIYIWDVKYALLHREPCLFGTGGQAIEKASESRDKGSQVGVVIAPRVGESHCVTTQALSACPDRDPWRTKQLELTSSNQTFPKKIQVSLLEKWGYRGEAAGIEPVHATYAGSESLVPENHTSGYNNNNTRSSLSIFWMVVGCQAV